MAAQPIVLKLVQVSILIQVLMKQSPPHHSQLLCNHHRHHHHHHHHHHHLQLFGRGRRSVHLQSVDSDLEGDEVVVRILEQDRAQEGSIRQHLERRIVGLHFLPLVFWRGEKKVANLLGQNAFFCLHRSSQMLKWSMGFEKPLATLSLMNNSVANLAVTWPYLSRETKSFFFSAITCAVTGRATTKNNHYYYYYINKFM